MYFNENFTQIIFTESIINSTYFIASYIGIMSISVDYLSHYNLYLILLQLHIKNDYLTSSGITNFLQL